MDDIKELPIAKDLCVRRGEDFTRNIFWKPGGVALDLTGYRAYMKIRDLPTNTDIESLSTDLDGYQEIKTGLFTDGIFQWNIEVKLPAVRTKVVSIGSYSYDFLLVSPLPATDSLFLLFGDFSFQREVTVNPIV